MVNSVHKFNNVLNRYSDVVYQVKESKYGFLDDLTKKERELGRSLFDYLAKKCLNYGYGEYYKTKDLDKFLNKKLEFEIEDKKGRLHNCRIVCDKASIYNEYKDILEGYKSLKLIQIQKEPHGNLETSVGLSKVFEGLIFSTAASGDFYNGYYVQEMTPEIIDLQLISRGLSLKRISEHISKGLSLKEAIEQCKHDCEEEKSKVREAEEEERKEIEESMAEESMFGYYERKVGKVTSLRGIKSQIINNKYLSYTE